MCEQDGMRRRIQMLFWETWRDWLLAYESALPIFQRVHNGKTFGRIFDSHWIESMLRWFNDDHILGSGELRNIR